MPRVLFSSDALRNYHTSHGISIGAMCMIFLIVACVDCCDFDLGACDIWRIVLGLGLV
jgi:hypothetical protein